MLTDPSHVLFPLILHQLSKTDDVINIIKLDFGNFSGCERHLIVGRHCSCDLQLQSKNTPGFLSRQHAKLTINTSQQVFIMDLRSMNGTFVNDVMLQPFAKTILNIGDTVTFGCCMPGVVICPGMMITQENAPFKYVLKKDDSNVKKIEHSELNSSVSEVVCEQSIKPISSATSCLARSSSSGNKEDDSDHDSGICIDETSKSSTRSVCNKQQTSKIQFKHECIVKNTDTVKKDDTLPLTVQNLLAFSGCNFNNMQSSNNKGNKNISKNASILKKSNPNIIETKDKPTKKRRRKSCFTTRKRTKKDTKELCASFECKLRSKQIDDQSEVVSWVQCDYCDNWYHTDCAGCDYNTVKSKKQKFRCGEC